MQAVLKQAENADLSPRAVEIEQARLSEAASVLQDHQRALRRRTERLAVRLGFICFGFFMVYGLGLRAIRGS
jgi:hypothetical protein